MPFVFYTYKEFYTYMYIMFAVSDQ